MLSSHLESQRHVSGGPDARGLRVPLPRSLEAGGWPSPGPTALTWETRVPARGGAGGSRGAGETSCPAHIPARALHVHADRHLAGLLRLRVLLTVLGAGVGGAWGEFYRRGTERFPAGWAHTQQGGDVRGSRFTDSRSRESCGAGMRHGSQARLLKARVSGLFPEWRARAPGAWQITLRTAFTRRGPTASGEAGWVGTIIPILQMGKQAQRGNTAQPLWGALASGFTTLEEIPFEPGTSGHNVFTPRDTWLRHTGLIGPWAVWLPRGSGDVASPA